MTMRVRLGDGREIDCERPIERLPPGPMPEVLASEWVATSSQGQRPAFLLSGYNVRKQVTIVHATGTEAMPE